MQTFFWSCWRAAAEHELRWFDYNFAIRTRTYWSYYMTKWTDWFDYNYDYDYGFAGLTKWTDWFDYDYDYGFAGLTN